MPRSTYPNGVIDRKTFEQILKRHGAGRPGLSNDSTFRGVDGRRMIQK